MNNLKYYVKAVPIGSFNSDIKGKKARPRTCPYCKNVFVRYGCEIEYKIGSKRFCSWNCKCKWRKENE